jgi:hypothetical protein
MQLNISDTLVKYGYIHVHSSDILCNNSKCNRMIYETSTCHTNYHVGWSNVITMKGFENKYTKREVEIL